MAKAINWPAQFLEEVLAEDCSETYTAYRLGSLYYENRYWVPGEIVDIRVNHKKVRQAQVLKDVQQCAIKDLTEQDLKHYKKDLQSQDNIIAFLSQTYNQTVTPETLITIVTYQNKPLPPEGTETNDDPHL